MPVAARDRWTEAAEGISCGACVERCGLSSVLFLRERLSWDLPGSAVPLAFDGTGRVGEGSREDWGEKGLFEEVSRRVGFGAGVGEVVDDRSCVVRSDSVVSLEPEGGFRSFAAPSPVATTDASASPPGTVMATATGLVGSLLCYQDKWCDLMVARTLKTSEDVEMGDDDDQGSKAWMPRLRRERSVARWLTGL